MGTTIATQDTGEPLLLTGSPGVTDYTFRQMRQLTAQLEEGVCTIGGFRVSPRGAGATMSVDIAPGYAYVQGDTATGPEGQHKYGVPLSATVNVAGVTAPASATRRDQVVLRVYDDGDAPAAGLNKGRVEYIANGTESLTAEAVPASALLLAYVDVPVGATSITSAMIKDRRAWSAQQLPHASCHLASTTVTLATDGTSPGQLVPLDTAGRDPWLMFTASGNGLFVAHPGTYIVTAQVVFAGHGTGVRGVSIMAGSTEAGRAAFVTPHASSQAVVGVTRVLRLAAGDVLTMRAAQNSGGALGVGPGPMQTFLDAAFLSA